MTNAAAHPEIVVAGLLLAVAALVTVARLLRVPYPIFLVVGGLAIGVIPGVPTVELDPDLVLLIFLPPLLYSASFFTSLRDLRQNVRPISLLSVGLVLATCVAVAAVAHAVVPGMSWPAAFVLGAIVSPTDPVAATAIAGRIGVPRRVVTIVEGESLINDATALVAYKVAVAAVLTGTFSALDAFGQFLIGAAGGIAIGVAVGYVVAAIRARLNDPPVEITISLLTAYAAYLPAEELGLSGVVAAVTVGLYMGLQTSRVTNAEVRMQSDAVWQILVFLLNSFLFILIGLQLPAILDVLRGEAYSTGDLVLYAAAASATVIVVRLIWSFVFAYVPHWLFKSLRTRNPIPSPRNVAIIAWMGMRGAVSLAAALALPIATDAGTPFPDRALILFVVFAVILSTLVLQGLSLPAVIRWLGVSRDEQAERAQESKARLRAADAALARIDLLAEEEWTRNDSIERVRGLYSYRRRRFASRFDDEEDDGAYEHRSTTYTRMMIAIIEAQREELERLRAEGRIPLEVLRAVEFDLDLEETRLAELR